MQFWRRIGRTSRAKSTLVGVWAGRAPAQIDMKSILCSKARLNIESPPGIASAYCSPLLAFPRNVLAIEFGGVLGMSFPAFRIDVPDSISAANVIWLNTKTAITDRPTRTKPIRLMVSALGNRLSGIWDAG